jgi:hypothetical protein
VAAAILKQHPKNPSNTTEDEIFIGLHNHSWQCFYFPVKPFDYFADGAILPRIQATLYSKLVHRLLHVNLKIAKLPAMAHMVVLEFHVNSHDLSFVGGYSLDLLLFLTPRQMCEGSNIHFPASHSLRTKSSGALQPLQSPSELIQAPPSSRRWPIQAQSRVRFATLPS